jgi:N-acyl homoserine lactone hydrolase
MPEQLANAYGTRALQPSRRELLKAGGSLLAASAMGRTPASAATPEPKRDGVSRVHAIQTGRVKVKMAQIEGCGHGTKRLAAPLLDSHWSDWLPTYAWVIEHREGVIVVDTGQTTHLKSLPAWHPYFQLAVQFEIEPEEEIGPQLRALGIGPKDVRQLVLTHVHMDHDSGLGHFPQTNILASKGEIERASGIAGRLRGYLPERWPSGFDPAPLVFESVPFGPFEKSRTLTKAGDVIALPTPGHTPDHLSVAVLEGDTVLFFAGDTSYAEHQMIAGIADGVSPDEELALTTLAKIRELARQKPLVYLPTHDPQSAMRLASRQTVTFKERT